WARGDRHHRTGQRTLLRPLQSHSPDCRRQSADLSLQRHGARSPFTAEEWSFRRRNRSMAQRRGLAKGGPPSYRRAGIRRSAALDELHWGLALINITTMPTYEYVCEKCGHEFEKVQPISAKPLAVCPEDSCAQKRWGKGK